MHTLPMRRTEHRLLQFWLQLCFGLCAVAVCLTLVIFLVLQLTTLVVEIWSRERNITWAKGQKVGTLRKSMAMCLCGVWTSFIHLLHVTASCYNSDITLVQAQYFPVERQIVTWKSAKFSASHICVLQHTGVPSETIRCVIDLMVR